MTAPRTKFQKAGVLWGRFVYLRIAGALLAAAILFAATAANARITKIQIISRGPAFGGFSFPGVGPYERIIGKGFGEISPADRHNHVIVDVETCAAQRRRQGRILLRFLHPEAGRSEQGQP